MELIAALDQGTQSTRCILFDKCLRIISCKQKVLPQIHPEPRYVEHDPNTILEHAAEVMRSCVEDLIKRNLDFSIRCIGIANQRESVVCWDKRTGKPLYNVIVWSDNRHSEFLESLGPETKKRIQELSGLRPSTYFSAVKIRWIIDNVLKKHDRPLSDVLCGTVDSWLLWNFTGGAHGAAKHLTDITNASRYMLMDIDTLEWSDELLRIADIPQSILPKIVPCCEELGTMVNAPHPVFANTPITGCSGDQQASCVGHGIIKPGTGKCTFGTCCSVIFNCGTELVRSENLITTVCTKLTWNSPTCYGLEGPIADVGLVLSWLKTNLKAFDSPKETEEILLRTQGDQDVTFIPSFSGLLAPEWTPDAKGVITGLTYHTSTDNIVSAFLKSIGYRLRAVMACVTNDLGPAYTASLRVDGGITGNETLMQLVSDIVNIKMEKAHLAELTSLGIGVLAGIGSKMFSGFDDHNIQNAVSFVERRWIPNAGDVKLHDYGYESYRQELERMLNPRAK